MTGLKGIFHPGTGDHRRLAILAIHSALVLLFLILGNGRFESTREFRGPLEPAPANSEILRLNLKTPQIMREIFRMSGDNETARSKSQMRLWLNGTEIQKINEAEQSKITRETTFTHRNDRVEIRVAQSLPNDGTLVVKTAQPLRLQGSIVTYLSLSLLLSIAPLAAPRLTRRQIEIALVAPWIALRGLIYAALLFTALYSALTGIAIAKGYAFPSVFPLQYFPVIRWIAAESPDFPYVLLIAILLAAGCGWYCERHAYASCAIECHQTALTRTLKWAGAPLLFALLMLSASAQWAGSLHPSDISTASIAGLVSFSDAGGYFADSFDFLTRGAFSEFAARRPMAAAARTTLAYLSGGSFAGIVAAQAALLGLALFFAAAAVARWRGTLAALVFASVMLLAMRGFVTTALTEPIGFVWALLSAGFLVEAVRANKVVYAAFGVFLMTITLLTRMGAMFLAPALILWVPLAFGWRQRRLLVTSALAAAAAGLAIAANIVIQKHYTLGADQLGSNFSYSLCGLSIGGVWYDCVQRYSSEIAALGPNHTEIDVVNLMYQKAIENVLASPQTFTLRVFNGMATFLIELPTILLNGYAKASTPVWFPALLLWAACIYGFSRIRLALDFRTISLFGLTLAASVASAGFVFFDDGRRVMMACYPLFAAIAASGLVVAAKPPPIGDANGLMRSGAVASLAAFMAIMIVPGLARSWHIQPDLKGQSSTSETRPILGGKKLAGLVVRDDAAQPEHCAASITSREFRSIVVHSGIEEYQTLVTPEAPPTPFGFVFGVDPIVPSNSHIYIVPAEVLCRPDVALWGLETEPWGRTNGGTVYYWYRAKRAVPLNLAGAP